MAIYYVDLENGNDSNSGTSFALRKKNISSFTSLANGDEIRVMGYPDVAVGVATSFVKDIEVRSTVTISSFSVAGGVVTLTTSGAHSLVTGDYIIIDGSTILQRNDGRSALNGMWRVTVTTSTAFTIDGLDATQLVNYGLDTPGTLRKCNDSLITISPDVGVGQYIASINENDFTYSWQNASTISATGSLTYANNRGIFGIYSTSAQLTPTGDTFTPGDRSSWTIRTTSGGTCSVTRIPYTMARFGSLSIQASGSFYGTWFGSGCPFNVTFFGTQYSGNNISFGTGTYVSFGIAVNGITSPTASSPFLPKIMLGSSTNSVQRHSWLTTGTAPNRIHTVRNEGTNNTSGTASTANIIYEVVFYENDPERIDINVERNACFNTIGVVPTTGANVDTAHEMGIPTFTTGKLFYKRLDQPLDLFGYNTLNFYSKIVSGTFVAGNITLRLCSDTTGDVPVVSVPLNSSSALGVFNRWISFRVDLTSTPFPISTPIQSISIACVSGPSQNAYTKYQITGLRASKQGIGYQDLVGRLGVPDNDQIWSPVFRLENRYGSDFIVRGQKSFSNIGNYDRNFITSGGDFIYGDLGRRSVGVTNATDTYTLALRRSIKVNNPTTFGTSTIQTINNGSNTTITVSGGWDRSGMTTRNGMTTLDGVFGAGVMFYINYRNAVIENFALVNAHEGFRIAAGVANVKVNNCSMLIMGNLGMTPLASVRNVGFTSSTLAGCYGGLDGVNNAAKFEFNDCFIAAHFGFGIVNRGSQGFNFINSTFSNNRSTHFQTVTLGGSHNFFSGCTFEGSKGPALTLANDTCDTVAYGCTFKRNNSFFSSNSSDTLSFVDCDIQDTTTTITSVTSTASYFQSRRRPYLCISGTNQHFPGSKLLNPSKYDPSYQYIDWMGGTSARLYTAITPVNAVNDYDGSSGKQILVLETNQFTYWNDPNKPLYFTLSQFPVPANIQTTYSIWVKRSSTGLFPRITLDAVSLDLGISNLGILTTSYNTTGSATNWQQLNLSFTPTKDGIAEIKFEHWANNSGYVYISDTSIT